MTQKMLGMKVEPEVVAEIERIANKRGMTKSQVARMLLKAGLEMHQDLEAVGVITVLDFGTTLYRQFQGAERERELRNVVTK